jgi:hypothetical protein
VQWGRASGDLSLDVRAALVEPLPADPNDPLANNGFASADGILVLRFVDTGTVTSDTLAPGTPVTLEISFRIETTALLPAAHRSERRQLCARTRLRGGAGSGVVVGRCEPPSRSATPPVGVASRA